MSYVLPSLVVFYALLPLMLAQSSCQNINAAFSVGEDGDIYFLSEDEYIKYSLGRQSEASVGLISDIGLNGGLREIDAAFTHSNGSVYLIKDCLFYRYRYIEEDGRLESDAQGTLSDLGLPCNISAAISWAGSILAFSGCEVWKMGPTHRFEVDSLLTTRGLPCNLDTAIEWSSSNAVFIKGTQFWRFGNNLEGPFHTDDLSLCSWYLCGEADWMTERRQNDTLKCNGDERLCPLRLNQVTLAGLHNAGAGFDGGFGVFNCWMRNHAQSITRQMEFGIRHLDIDPCYEICGLLGTCHAFACGGSICRIIKQVRTFLKEHRDEVVTLNFNHEVVDPELVFPALTRQLKTQLKPMLNNRYRLSGQQSWPTLRSSIRRNKRVFVFYAPIIEQSPHNRIYARNKWIHTENWYGSTWQPFSAAVACRGVVPITAARCKTRQNRELVEVSVIPESRGGCITSTAQRCRPRLHEALVACEDYRFRHNNSVNVLLVDYPEIDRDKVNSVFHAVYHQNIRNIYQLRPGSCQVKVNAAVSLPNNNTVLFFVGSKIIIYRHNDHAQVGERITEEVGLTDVDAAHLIPGNPQKIRVYKGCWTLDLDPFTLQPVSRTQPSEQCEPIDASSLWRSRYYFFRGCNVTVRHFNATSLSVSVSEWGLPCFLDASFEFNDTLYLFKGNNYWTYNGTGLASSEGRTLNFIIDAVQCN